MSPVNRLVIGVLLVVGPPAAAQSPPALPADRLAKLKAATAYIKVQTLVMQGSGSGFVIRADEKFGWLVTNNHVIDPVSYRYFLRDNIPAKTSVRVVFHGGTAEQWDTLAEVVARDPERDLAVLKIPARKPIPSAIPLTGAATVAETTSVFVCG